ncbi:amidase [Pedobacter polysacchareus]|uniref:amidase n=1 Tax=Pedobacter polysacchareus TaxID=2861973 RepID=UPI001C99AE65|nr:amidase [Pedobacter polysacchareus]
MMKNPGQYSISELGQQLRAGTLSCVTLTEVVLKDIKTRNPYFKAFILILEERALEEALQAQIAFNNGLDLGPLHGIPYAVKGIFDVAGFPNTAGLGILEEQISTAWPMDYIPSSDAASIRLLKQAGAILVGITNTSPLAATILGINHVFETPHNPWKTEAYLPGGSSSGSAVAVAAGMVPFALGSDTGGSIRVPASLCGVVGFKPTKGWLSTQGVWPLAPSLDTIGLIAAIVADVKIVYSQLQDSGFQDSRFQNDKVQTEGARNSRFSTLQEPKLPMADLRIGCCKTIFFDDADPEVILAVERSLKILGSPVSTVEIPIIQQLREMMKENSLIASEAYPLHEEIISHPNIDWVLNWLKSAAAHSLRDTEAIQKQYAAIAAQLSLSRYGIEVLVVPTTPLPAVLRSDCDEPSSHAALSSIYSRNTLIANLAGWCSISVPCGLTKDGLPIGLMFCADPHHEAVLISLAEAFENSSGNKKMAPYKNRNRPEIQL